MTAKTNIKKPVFNSRFISCFCHFISKSRPALPNIQWKRCRASESGRHPIDPKEGGFGKHREKAGYPCFLLLSKREIITTATFVICTCFQFDPV